MTEGARDRAQHREDHRVDDILDAQHEIRHATEDAAAVVTRDDVDALMKSVEGLEDVIEVLAAKMDRQWNAQQHKRRRLAWWLAVYTVVVAYAVGAMVDEHVRNCMTFGSVPSERTKAICDITMPFHDHHMGGISDEDFIDAIERAQRVWEEQE